MQILGKEAAWASLVSTRQQKSPSFYLLGKGVTDLAEPLIKALASLPIVPHACAQIASATCTCGDFSDDAWCKHVAAVGYHIINSCEIDPFYPFHLRQLDIAELSNIGTPKRCVGACNPRCPTSKCICPSEARQPECICLSDDEDGSSLEHAIKCDWASRERGGVVSGTAAKREPVLWRRAAPCVSVCLACAVSVPGETRACMVMVSSIRRQYPNTGYKQVPVYVS